MNGWRVKTTSKSPAVAFFVVVGIGRRRLKDMAIEEIDMVCVNLYPLKPPLNAQIAISKAIENIDIGGPTMVSLCAAKNHKDVAIVVSPTS